MKAKERRTRVSDAISERGSRDERCKAGTECTRLHLPSQSLEDVPEDLHAELEDLSDGGDRVPTETEAEVLLGRLDEGSSRRARRRDEDLRGGEESDVGLEDSEDEVEREEFGSHGVGFDVAFAEGKEKQGGGKRGSARVRSAIEAKRNI